MLLFIVDVTSQISDRSGRRNVTIIKNEYDMPELEVTINDKVLN